MEETSGPYISPAGTGQVVSYTGTAGTISNAIENATYLWVFCTSVAHIKVSYDGDATAALTTDFPVPANFPVKIQLKPNAKGVKVSAIQSAAGGNLHVCPVAF